MNRLRLWVMVCGCLLLTLPAVMGQAKSYLIERGDVLDVVVMEHPEFSLTGIIVLPDGTMQYPGIGSILAAGMSSDALTASVEKSVGKYVVNPLVSVFIRKIQNQMLNVLGYVNKPGQFQIYEGVDLLTALSMAGGIKNIKKGKQVIIIHADQSMEVIKLKEYINPGHQVKKMPVLYAGDTVMVKEPGEVNWSKFSFFASLLTAFAYILNATL